MRDTYIDPQTAMFLRDDGIVLVFVTGQQMFVKDITVLAQHQQFRSKSADSYKFVEFLQNQDLNLER